MTQNLNPWPRSVNQLGALSLPMSVPNLNNPSRASFVIAFTSFIAKTNPDGMRKNSPKFQISTQRTYVEQPTNAHFTSNFMDLTAKTWSEKKNFRMTKMNTFSDAVTSIFDPWYWKACQHRDTTTLNVRAKFKNNQSSVFWVIPLTLFIPRVVVSTCNDNPSDTEDMISTIAFNLFRGV